MNISYSWLKNYIKTDKTPAEIAEILTALGLETGSMEVVETIKGGLKGLVVGNVLTCAKHPNADKLSVTTVNTGGGEPLHIVCGASNVRAGQKVVVATVGTVLYSGDECFTIKKSKIRGELSEGMICAEDEIGLGKSHDGIMTLPPDTPTGMPAAEYFNMESDIVFEVDLTPNRIDAASHLGVARDLAASLCLTDSFVKVSIPSVDSFKADSNSYPVKVTVENSEACIRYSGLTISGVRTGESPDWLKNRLRSIGLTPINNIVDVTNFVLHECGQPLHAFDGDKITGNHVIVKTLGEGTKFTTLDGKERNLSADDLMICNEATGMCIAGVFGGLESGVGESTTRIFLESACFNPVSVRKTSRRHGLFTDASFRYERGSDPNITVYALKRAAMLIKEVAGGEISSGIVDIYPAPVADANVTVAFNTINRLIGKNIEPATVKNILQSLDIRIITENNDELRLAVPPYRADVRREADVIEEILRVYGYNNVEISSKLNSSVVYSEKPDRQQTENLIASQLVGAGFNEIMSNSLTRAAYYDKSDNFLRTQTIELLNPLSNDLNGMRQTLLFGGLEAIERNKNRRRPDLKLFEFGNCYYFNGGEKSDLASYSEQKNLALFVTGKNVSDNWNTPVRISTFYDLKAHCENVLSRLGIGKSRWKLDTPQSSLFAESLLYTLNNKVLVTVGQVNQTLQQQFDIDTPVYFAEFCWDNLLKLMPRQNILFKELSKFPEVRRDLALLVDNSVKYSSIEEIAFRTERKFLKEVSLFDVYTGEKLEPGKKSYAVSFILEDTTKTLTDTQIDRIMQNLTQAFGKELGASLR
ncbi:MAG: phenylalanine--tRNA ligase subunit beta [Cytophagaceae bacterium]|jgi:phenylalanyl-tRNA synthetase beta chain|nr:phenylalanine--tRNA ligase subunit beta [Cytophagaceae bacterium]